MQEKKYRIAGPDSEMATEFPEAATLMEVAGKDMSRIVYGSVKAMIRIAGFQPDTKRAAKDFVKFLQIYNTYEVLPQAMPQISGQQSGPVQPAKYQKPLLSQDYQPAELSDPTQDTHFV